MKEIDEMTEEVILMSAALKFQVDVPDENERVRQIEELETIIGHALKDVPVYKSFLAICIVRGIIMEVFRKLDTGGDDKNGSIQ